MEQLIVRNPDDVLREAEGKLTWAEVRSLTLTALVDTGTYWCGLHRQHIEALGLRRFKTVPVSTGNGIRESRIFSPGPEFELLGRQTIMDVIELPENAPPLIGVGLLEALVFVVDPISQRVTGDPRHGGRREHWLLFGKSA